MAPNNTMQSTSAEEWAKRKLEKAKREQDKRIAAEQHAANAPQKEETVTEATQEKTVAEQIEDEINKLGLPETVTVVTVEGATPASAGAPKAKREPKAKVERTLPENATSCRVCGKTLTDPTSVTRNVGPVCIRNMTRTLGMTVAEFDKFVAEATNEKWTEAVNKTRTELEAHGDLTEVPDGYIAMSDAWRQINQQVPALTNSAISRAFGGDRCVNEPVNEHFASVYVLQGARQRKYVPATVVEAAKALPIQSRELKGAALAAKTRSEAKKEEKAS